MISREIRNTQKKAVGESLPSAPCSRGRSGYSETPQSSFLSQMVCALSHPCTSKDRSLSFSLSLQPARAKPYFSLSPSSTKQLHSPHIPAAWDTLLLPLPTWSTACCHAPGETTHQLLGVVLSPRCVVMVEDKFYHSAKHTRCHSPMICKCNYRV